MKGYPCRDQIGRTSGFGPDGKQTFSPVYSWNNNFQGVIGGHLYVQGYATIPPGGSERISEHVVEGRDFFNGVPRPGYTPYIYPHPLTTSGFTSDVGGPIMTVQVGNPAPSITSAIIIPPLVPVTTITSPSTILGDFNSDNKVNSLDFSVMSTKWNQASVTHDLNKDGTVNTLDFSIMATHWTG